jgi:hypothetical protein
VGFGGKIKLSHIYYNVKKIAFSWGMKVAPGRGRELAKQKSRPDRRESKETLYLTIR